MCAVGRWIYDRGYVASMDGNLSVRLDTQHILTSPTGICKGMMTPEDMVITDMDGKKVSGRRNPSSELPMHLMIYQHRTDVNAVCHAHPPAATGYAAAGVPLNKALLCELILSLGCVPVAPYGTPGTPELADSIAPFVDGYDAILLANHGVVSYGQDLMTAFFRMETTGAFRACGAGDRDAWQAGAAFEQRRAEIGGGAARVMVCRRRRTRGRNFRLLRRSCGDHRADYFDAPGA